MATQYRPSIMATKPFPSCPAFTHLNLIRNPFGYLSRGELARIAIVDVAHTVTRLGNPAERIAVQFLGDQGYGKSTHLFAIHRHFPQAPFAYFAEGETVVVPRGDFLFLDELQRVSWRQRRRLYRVATKLVVATHVDYSAEMQRAGFRVDSVDVRDTMTVDLLWQVLNRKIEAARYGLGRLPRVTHSTAVRLWQQHQGNPRSIEAELYEIYQSLQELRDV